MGLKLYTNVSVYIRVNVAHTKMYTDCLSAFMGWVNLTFSRTGTTGTHAYILTKGS